MAFPFLTNLLEETVAALPTLEKLASGGGSIDSVISAAREAGYVLNTKEARSVVRGYRDLNQRRDYQNNLDPGTFYDPSKISQAQSQLRSPFQVLVKVIGRSQISGRPDEATYKLNFSKAPNDQQVYEFVAEQFNELQANAEDGTAGSDIVIPSEVIILDRIASA